ncbi:hypothetical protein NX059_007954 [Plenodomus lindquistii]|nr:hypothetical protein NX059_007954 [Plenodomus lindquistii]
MSRVCPTPHTHTYTHHSTVTTTAITKPAPSMNDAAPSLLEITRLTRQELTARRHDDDDDDPIRKCGRAALALLRRDPEFAAKLAYQKLHDVPYKDVKTCWRRLYVDAKLWCIMGLVEEGRQGEETQCEDGGGALRRGKDWVDGVVTALDMALILTGAPAREELVELWFSALRRYLNDLEAADGDVESKRRPAKRRRLSCSSSSDTAMPSSFPTSFSTVPPPNLRYPIPRAQAPGLEAFQKKLDRIETHTPLIIEGAIDHWPALEERPWSSPAYLMQQTLGGRRLVPVEVGRSYTDDAWGQRIVSFREFMEMYMLGTPSAENGHGHDEPHTVPGDETKKDEGKTETQTGYLAQHDLFAQIPGLRADISIPDYCYCTPAAPSIPCSTNSHTQLEEPLLNAWFGPAHTISPLHTDPYHNILAQVVGYKYVRLYAPSETARLYPRGVEDGGVDMGNTSSVDLDEAVRLCGGDDWVGWRGSGAERKEEGVEERRREFEEKYPGFKDARYVEGVLGPGECLYLPVGWWHYVTSLTPSFSVSFWFN